MENVWSREVDSILCVGSSLENSGVRNWAIGRQAALMALDRLAEIGVAVLGGDVYVSTDQGLESNYDNWYCNKNSGESESDFVTRSVKESINFIANYKMKNPEVFFSIVPSIKF